MEEDGESLFEVGYGVAEAWVAGVDDLFYGLGQHFWLEAVVFFFFDDGE